jgi:RNA polymerase sigma-70 factor (ECF subfamily)
MEAVLKAAWPQLAIDAAAFAQQLRDPGSAHLADLYLAFACARGEPIALRLLEDCCFARLDSVLTRVLPDASDRDEVKQRLRDKLLVSDGKSPARIATYAGKGELFSWLAVAAAREAISLTRARGPAPLEQADEVQALLRGAGVELDPHLAYTKKLYRAQFEDAFREALGTLESKDRAVLRHQLIDHLTLDEIAAVYRIHPVSAARRLTRARSELLSATRRSLTRRLQLAGAELDSLLRLVRSQVDLSLGRLIQHSTEPEKKDR